MCIKQYQNQCGMEFEKFLLLNVALISYLSRSGVYMSPPEGATICWTLAWKEVGIYLNFTTMSLLKRTASPTNGTMRNWGISFYTRVGGLIFKFIKQNEHWKQDPIYVFPEMKLRGLVPNFSIHVSMSDLCIPIIGPPILLQQNRRTARGNT